MPQTKLYALYSPILKKMGVLSRFVLITKVEEKIPKEFIDDYGFWRIREFISYKRKQFVTGIKTATPDENVVGWEFYEQYVAENYPDYDAFLTILAILLKSTEAFYSGRTVWSGVTLDVEREKRKIMALLPGESVSKLFESACRDRMDTITKENDAIARNLIKTVMDVANDQYKTLKENDLQKV